MYWNLPELITALASLTGAGAVSYGAYIAKKGLEAWRDEILGKRKIELAERAIGVFIGARDAIRMARNPFMAGGEIVEVYRAVHKDQEPADWKNLNQPALAYYGTMHRLNSKRDLFVELEALRPLLTVYFGEDIGTKVDEVFKAQREVAIGAQMLVTMAQQEEQRRERSREAYAKYEAAIWRQAEDDVLDTRLSQAVESALATFRNILIKK